MTMFKKVFGKHLANHTGEPALVPLVPMGGGVAQSAVALGSERETYPEMVSHPKPPKTAPQILETAQDNETGPDLAARAAEAHRQIVETKLRPRFAETPQEVANDVSILDISANAETRVTGPDPVVSVDPTPVQFARRSGGRTRTRLLGFDHGSDDVKDIFADTNTPAPLSQTFPTGWMVVASGPGQGHFFPLFSGVAMIGRGEGQTIRLDFGDEAISRQNHAAVAYDNEDNKFYLGHGGKSNIIRLNGRPVLATEELGDGDTIRIGETTLRFVALCGQSFSWSENLDG